MLAQIESALSQLRQIKPLVLNLTNYVTMDFMANALLSVGAAPMMSVCETEFEELVMMAHTVNINLGTLDDSFIRRCFQIARFAKQYEKPLILDPVGAGASVMRTKAARALMVDANVVRGNASEIISLFESSGKTLGVESINDPQEAKDKAQEMAHRHGITIVATGPVDLITNGKEIIEIAVGSPLMPLVTGMGCTLTAVIAAFLGTSIKVDAFESAKLATTYFGLCGNVAESIAHHPASFRTAFIDALHAADFTKMQAYIPINE